jgi:hypothetical protein
MAPTITEECPLLFLPSQSAIARIVEEWPPGGILLGDYTDRHAVVSLAIDPLLLTCNNIKLAKIYYRALAIIL